MENPFGVNFDEDKIRPYILPELFPAGCNRERWENEIRPQWMEKLTEIQFGKIPPAPAGMRFRMIDEKEMPGLGMRRQYRLTFSNGNAARDKDLDVIVYLPASCGEKPAPAFCMLNFKGNHSAETDPALIVPDYPRGFMDEVEPVAEKDRGAEAHRYSPEVLLRRGYALISACYNQIYTDYPGYAPDSIYRLFMEDVPSDLPAISAWAWGLSRLADFAEELKEIDGKRLGVIGHSRLGKTSLWAGVNDARFKLVVSNNSGCGGSALLNRDYGETLEVMFYKAKFFFWFSPELKLYALCPEKLPFDSHTLMAMVAPRALYIASATEDQWADPTGEFLALRAAAPVWKLYGLESLGRDVPPPPATPVQIGSTAYHCRIGAHNLMPYDWENYLDFADRILA